MVCNKKWKPVSVQAKQLFDKCYSDSAPLETAVKRRYADFKHSCTDTNDAKHSGCSNLAVVPENTKKFHKLVLADHKLKLIEIAEELKISEGNVFTILDEHLSMRKLCSKWVLCWLTVNQKHRVDDSEHCLQLFQRNNEFLHKCVTMDKTWIHHCTLESNWLSAEWTAAGESRPKWPSAGKVLASVFWDAQGILFINYHEKGSTINKRILYSIIGVFKGRNCQKMATNEEEKVLFHQDNAPCHKSITTMAKLDELHFELLPHPP